MADAMGTNAAVLTRLSISKMLAAHNLTGNPPDGAASFDEFFAEMRSAPRPQDPRWQAVVTALETAITGMDEKADGSPSDAGLWEALCLVARSTGPIEKRLALMTELISIRGKVTAAIPRELVHPKRKAKGT